MMRTRLIMVATFLVLVSSICLGSPINKGRPDSEIELIMKAGFGGYPPVLKRPFERLREGMATKKETEQLVELCRKLGEARPPKGDIKEWKKLTDDLLKAAKDVEAGGQDKVDALKRLKAAGDCMACHDKFRLTRDEEKVRLEEYLKQKQTKDEIGRRACAPAFLRVDDELQSRERSLVDLALELANRSLEKETVRAHFRVARGQIDIKKQMWNAANAELSFAWWRAPTTRQSYRNPRSFNCRLSTGAGAPVIRSRPLWFLGKAITSRMFVVPASIMVKRSKPRAMPPCGGAPNLRASSKKPKR